MATVRRTSPHSVLRLIEFDKDFGWKLIGCFMLGGFVTVRVLGGLHPLILALAPVLLLPPGRSLHALSLVVPIGRDRRARLAWATRVLMIPAATSMAAANALAWGGADAMDVVEYGAACLLPAVGFMAWGFATHVYGSLWQRLPLQCALLWMFLFIPTRVSDWNALHYATIACGLAGMVVAWYLAPKAVKTRAGVMKVHAATPASGGEFSAPDFVYRYFSGGMFGTLPRWFPLLVVAAALTSMSSSVNTHYLAMVGLGPAFLILLMLPMSVLFGHSPGVYASLPLSRRRRTWIPVRNHLIVIVVACAAVAPLLFTRPVPALALVVMVSGYGFLGKASIRLFVSRPFFLVTRPTAWLLRKTAADKRVGAHLDFLATTLGILGMFVSILLSMWLLETARVYALRIIAAAGFELYVAAATAPAALLAGVWLLYRYEHEFARANSNEFPRIADGRAG